jgi:hypothetical protein
MTFCHKGGYMKNRDLCFFGKIGTEKAKKSLSIYWRKSTDIENT